MKLTHPTRLQTVQRQTGARQSRDRAPQLPHLPSAVVPAAQCWGLTSASASCATLVTVNEMKVWSVNALITADFDAAEEGCMTMDDGFVITAVVHPPTYLNKVRRAFLT